MGLSSWACAAYAFALMSPEEEKRARRGFKGAFVRVSYP
jgi:hypothetical protein